MYTRMKGKSDADVVNKAMRYWVPFAARQVKLKTPGPAKLRRDLSNKARKPRKRNKVLHGLMNSKIAGIVAARYYDKFGPGWRRMEGYSDHEFYDKVHKVLEARVSGSRYNQAGFIPAYRKFDIPNRVGGHTRFKGRSKGIKAVPSMRGTAEAFVTNQREAAAKIAPDAFRRTIVAVRRQFLRWIYQDMVRMAKKSGF
jgi:hypothetical protein